jgi:zinc D-Ala-D-Ala carboxypeptidase
MTQLSPHFSLAELTHSDVAVRNGWDNLPDEATQANLVRLAEFLERVKRLLNDKPVMINSAYRSKQVNDAVGSKDTSQHRLGCAADIRVPGMTPDEVTKAIMGSNLPFDQVIREFDSWTHVSVPNREGEQPRGQALIIDKTGTRVYV